ncbi:MAG: glycosyltransferase family 4 protein [Bacteroidaceae bacterium]|nr:glycosyltransferase family 4 protein [Bacteroidaceae bacterium]
MKRIIYIRRNPDMNADGTVAYCNALYEMFREDDDCRAEKVENYPVWNVPLMKYIYKPSALKKAIAQADIVHVNGYTAFGTLQALVYARRMHKTVVYIAHWHPFKYLSHPVLSEVFFHILFKPVIKACADRIVAINNDDFRFFSSFSNKVIIIHHWFVPENTGNHSVQRSKDMILFVGRLNDPIKNFKMLNNIAPDRYEVHCVGRGDVVLRPDFVRHQNVSREELASLYKQASLVVVSSRYEAFSYVAMEAMSNGTPVLMSDNVRIADFLDGVSGYAVYQQDNVEDFLQKVDSTIGISVDVDKVLDIFSAESAKKEYKKLYLYSK